MEQLLDELERNYRETQDRLPTPRSTTTTARRPRSAAD